MINSALGSSISSDSSSGAAHDDLLEVQDVEPGVAFRQPGELRPLFGFRRGRAEFFGEVDALLHDLFVVGVADIDGGIILRRMQRQRFELALLVAGQIGQLEPRIDLPQDLGDLFEAGPLHGVEQHEIRFAPFVIAVFKS